MPNDRRVGPARQTEALGKYVLSSPWNKMCGTIPSGHWPFQYAAEEVSAGRPGSETVLAMLSELLFVEAVRRYAEALPDGQTGWLAGLREPYVARALALLHRDITRRWTVNDLGREVGSICCAEGRARSAGPPKRRRATRAGRATKAFYPALSMCHLIFSGVFERRPRLTLAIVEFELAWALHLLSTMDYTYRERPRRGDLPVQGPALAKAGDGLLPSDFFRRNVVLSFQEDAIGGPDQV